VERTAGGHVWDGLPYPGLVAGAPSDPGEVWNLIRRADDLVKYSANRDPAVARTQAREVLERAVRAAEGLDDRRAGDTLASQARTRLADLEEP
jgi:hypothetical protein